jgi:hypothetical protein
MKTSQAIAITAAVVLLSLSIAATNSNRRLRSGGEPEKRVLSLFPVLADPGKFHGQEIDIEAFVASAEGHYVLAPTLSCIANSTGPSLVNLDINRCRGKEKLNSLNPGICYLRGTVDAAEYGGPPPMAFTFRAIECKNAVRVKGVGAQ